MEEFFTNVESLGESAVDLWKSICTEEINPMDFKDKGENMA